MSRKNKTIEAGVLHRGFSVNRSAINKDERTVELAFSSEEPVDRWFGVEILDHASSSINLGRLQNGGAVLVDHDPSDHVGVVESVSVGDDRRGRATVRFGSSDRAEEIWKDVVDGIRHNVSVGYRIDKMVLEGEEKGVETYRATLWTPFEVSMVSIPADSTVGVGRSEEADKQSIVIENLYEEERVMSEETDIVDATPEVDVEAVKAAARDEAMKSEAQRSKEMYAMGKEYSEAELASEFVVTGKSVEELRAAILDKKVSQENVMESADIGMSESEVRQFSFTNVINALANPHDKRAQENAAFEFEASRAVAEKNGQAPKGLFVPTDVLGAKRDMTAGVNAAGGHTVATDLLAESFIETLDNMMTMVSAGATVMRDLQGNIAIPRQTSGTTAYWVAENAATTESAAAFDQVTMSPTTVGAFSDLSRRLLIQSSLDIEAFIRMDLAKRLALAIDNKALEGDGTGNTPTGIINTSGIGTKALATDNAPTFAEMVDVETEVSKDNALMGSLAYIVNPTVAGNLKQTKKDAGSGIYVMEGGQVNGYNVFNTNQLSTGTATDDAAAVFGNFADLLIGYWGGLDINVDTSTGSTAGTVRVVALQDVDVAVRHAESFSVATNP